MQHFIASYNKVFTIMHSLYPRDVGLVLRLLFLAVTVVVLGFKKICTVSCGSYLRARTSLFRVLATAMRTTALYCA